MAMDNNTVLNPDGPDVSIAGPMMRTIWTLYGIMFVVVVLRLYTQWRITRSLGLGDAMMFLSIVCGTGILSTLTIQYHYGLGRHFSYLDPHQKVEALYYNFIGQPLGIMAPAFGRSASCIMMLQLFGTTNARRYTLWFIFWESIVVNFVTCVLIFVQCKDPRTLWDPLGHPGYCWRPLIQEYTGFAQGGINSATDLFLTILPIRIFYTLKMSMRLKLGLGFLLGLSSFAFVASITKTVQLQSIGQRGDFTFGTVNFFTWVIVETTLVDIAASAPLVLPLFRKMRKGPSTEQKHSYQLRKYGGHSIVIRGGRSADSRGRYKGSKGRPRDDLATETNLEYGDGDLENAVAFTDSEEILKLRGSEMSNSSPGAKGKFENDGIEGGNMDAKRERRSASPACKRVIVKQTSFDVSFRANEGSRPNAGGTRVRDDMWMAKELPKIPWEAHNECAGPYR